MAPEIEDRMEIVRLALRVLHGITERQYPTESDVAKLRNWRLDGTEHLAIDELCCEIVQSSIWWTKKAERLRAAA